MRRCRRLPLLIHEAETGQPQGLARTVLMIKRSLDTQIANGMHFAVVCSEDAPRWTSGPCRTRRWPKPISAKASCRRCGPFANNGRAARWTRISANRSQSAIPTLVLSGGNDPVTPARYGEKVVAGSVECRSTWCSTARGTARSPVGCMPRVVADFISRRRREQSLDDSVPEDRHPRSFPAVRSAPAP